jgi:hypothetical protein
MPEIVISGLRRRSTNSSKSSDRGEEETDSVPRPEHHQRNSAAGLRRRVHQILTLKLC